MALVGKPAGQTQTVLPMLFENLDKKGINVLTPSLEHSELTFAFLVASADLHTALEVTHVTAFQHQAS